MLRSCMISSEADLCSFDFSGCGNSGGKYVTLGWKEVEDLHAILQYLSIRGYTHCVLYGRSMGAFSILRLLSLEGKYLPPLLHASLPLSSSFIPSTHNMRVCGVIADSPFWSFHELGLYESC